MQRLLDILSALADPTRVRILLLLRMAELSMGELAEVLGQSQPRVSRHVRILAEAGLVRRAREGAWVFVTLGRTAPLGDLFSTIDRLLDGEDPLCAERVRLEAVRAARRQALDRWFAEHAEDWDRMALLEGRADGVEPRLVERARAGGVGRLLDIGTGTGRILELLAADSDRALGIDRSPEMLRVARARLAQSDPARIEVRQADMMTLSAQLGVFDTVVMHQVLHFADDPAAALAVAARMVAPGGKLLLVDYARHGEDELSRRFAHLRMGFETHDILGWMAAGGLLGTLVGRFDGPVLTTMIWEGRR